MKATLFLLLAAVFVLLILGVAALSGQVVILALPLIVYVMAATLHRPEAVNLKITREITPEFAPQGTPITVRLTITNQGQTIDELDIQDMMPSGIRRIDGESSALAFVEPRGQIELEYTIEAERGAYKNYDLVVYARDAHDLFEQALTYQSHHRLLAHPRYAKLDRIRIRPPQTRGFAGPIAARQGGVGVDFWGIREYQSGDSQRQINWKRAAPTEHELYTNIFEQERVADVGIILDARQRVNVVTDSGSLFEYSVFAAASLADNFLNNGNRVSLMIYGSGRERAYAGYGRVQRDRILKALSSAKPVLNYALANLDYLPTRLFPPKSQLVIVSPLAAEDIPIIVQMRARGYAVILISPDPVSYESARYQDFTSPAYRLAYAERSFMLRQIQRCGVQVVNWRVDQPLEMVVRNKLEHQPAGFHHNRVNV